jgi:hypothetical protein
VKEGKKGIKAWHPEKKSKTKEEGKRKKKKPILSIIILSENVLNSLSKRNKAAK